MTTEPPQKPRLARFEMNPSLLGELLNLPAQISVVGVTWITHKRCLELFISGPDFRPVGEGETIPKLFPSLVRDADSNAPVWRWQGEYGEKQK